MRRALELAAGLQFPLADGRADCNTHRDGHLAAHVDANADANTHRDSHTDADPDPDSDSNPYAHSYADGDPLGIALGNPHHCLVLRTVLLASRHDGQRSHLGQAGPVR